MKTTVVACTLASFLLPASLWAQSPRRALDQEQPNSDTGTGTTSAIGGASEQMLAQTVTAGRAGALTEVRLPIACARGQMIVEIQGVTPTGEPDGIVRGSRQVPAALLPATFPPAFQTFHFGSRLTLAVGEQFAIVMRVRTPPDQVCGIPDGPGGNPYSGGETFFDARPNAPGWVRIGDGRDFPFETLVLESATP